MTDFERGMNAADRQHKTAHTANACNDRVLLGINSRHITVVDSMTPDDARALCRDIWNAAAEAERFEQEELHDAAVAAGIAA